MEKTAGRSPDAILTAHHWTSSKGFKICIFFHPSNSCSTCEAHRPNKTAQDISHTECNRLSTFNVIHFLSEVSGRETCPAARSCGWKTEGPGSCCPGSPVPPSPSLPARKHRLISRGAAETAREQRSAARTPAAPGLPGTHPLRRQRGKRCPCRHTALNGTRTYAGLF